MPAKPPRNLPLCALSVSALSSPILCLQHSPLSPVFRTFFQVPYPATPLFATLTKTAGVCSNNSHSGTSSPRASPMATHHTPFYSSAFFSHSCALFCTFLHSPKTQPFSFQE